VVSRVHSPQAESERTSAARSPERNAAAIIF